MPLSDNQMQRLEQLQIPRWVSRNTKVSLLVEEKALIIEEPKLLNSNSDNPSLFWIVEDELIQLSEKFVDDVSISIHGQNAFWQILCCNHQQLEKLIRDKSNKSVFIVINDSLTNVEISKESLPVVIQVPLAIPQSLSLKRTLWSLIKSTFNGAQ